MPLTCRSSRGENVPTFSQNPYYLDLFSCYENLSISGFSVVALASLPYLRSTAAFGMFGRALLDCRFFTYSAGRPLAPLLRLPNLDSQAPGDVILLQIRV